MHVSRVGIVGLGLVLAACAGATDHRTSSSSEIIEEEATKPIEGHLASCTVASTDVTTVSCTDVSASLPTKFLLDVTVTGADGKTTSFTLWDRPEGSARLFPSFPLTIEVKASRKAGSDDAQYLEPMQLSQKLTVAAATTTPIDVRLPYDFWPVTVSGSQYALMTSARRATSVAPWTAENASEAQIEERIAPVRADAPAKAILLAPVGATSIPVSFTFKDESVVEAAFDGPGAFVVGANGLVRAGNAAAPPSSSGSEPTSFGDAPGSFLACHAGASSVDGQAVSCSLREVAGMKLTYADVTLKDAEGRKGSLVTLATGDALIGHCVTAPCSVTGAVRYEVDGQTFSGELALPLGGEPATLALPFERFTASVDTTGLDPAKAKLAEIRLGAVSTVPAGAGWTTETVLSPFSMRASSTSGSFAVPAGTTTLAAHVVGIDLVAKKKVETDGTMTNGKKYVLSPDFNLVAVP